MFFVRSLFFKKRNKKRFWVREWKIVFVWSQVSPQVIM